MTVMALRREWVFSLPFASHVNRMKLASESQVGDIVTTLITGPQFSLYDQKLKGKKLC